MPQRLIGSRAVAACEIIATIVAVILSRRLAGEGHGVLAFGLGIGVPSIVWLLACWQLSQLERARVQHRAAEEIELIQQLLRADDATVASLLRASQAEVARWRAGEVPVERCGEVRQVFARVVARYRHRSAAAPSSAHEL